MKNFSVHTRLTIMNTGVGFHELLSLFRKKGGDSPTPFHSLIPMPKEIWDTEATSFDDISREGDLDFLFSEEKFWDKGNHGICRPLTSAEVAEYKSTSSKNESLLDKYGVKNWRQWALKNWDTPWEAHNVKIKRHNKKEVLITFSTDSTPPLKVLEAICMKFPKITFVYDIYSYDFYRPVACTGGYEPFSYFKQDIAHISNEKYECYATILSDKFLKVCQKFSKFPLGGPILREYDPTTESEITKTILDALKIEIR